MGIKAVDDGPQLISQGFQNTSGFEGQGYVELVDIDSDVSLYADSGQYSISNQTMSVQFAGCDACSVRSGDGRDINAFRSIRRQGQQLLAKRINNRRTVFPIYVQP